MSLGMRIAQKRKEMGLSQEALGERLSVSRQAIYKWEADAALPEIEKLVALAGIFGVSVGWLLGVEEDEAGPQTNQDELTPGQLKMVEELISRYLGAERKSRRRSWLRIAAGVAALLVGVHLLTRLDTLESRYNSLQNSINGISSSVNSRVDGIVGQIEELLKAQGELTVAYDVQISGEDLVANTLDISLQATPKTFRDGLSAVFVVDNGAGPQEFPAVLEASSVFTAKATVPLSDSISVSVVFIDPEGTRQTQLLTLWEGLLRESRIGVSIQSSLFGLPVKDGVVRLQDNCIIVRQDGGVKVLSGVEVSIEEIKVGLFCNQRLIAWAEPCDQPSNYLGDWDGDFYRLPVMTLKNVDEGDMLCAAVLITDNFGRQYICADAPVTPVDTDSKDACLMYSAEWREDQDPTHWSFS